MAARKKKKEEPKNEPDNTSAIPDTVISIPELDIRHVDLRLVGMSPLVTHCWSEKAKKIIRDKTQGKAAAARGVKNPEEDFEFARYRFFRTGKPAPKGAQRDPDEGDDARDGFPAHRIADAMVHACSFLPRQVTKVVIRSAVFVNIGSYLVPIQYAEDPTDPNTEWLDYGVDVQPIMREDTERVGGKGKGTGNPDLRYRPQYDNWSIPVRISYNARMLTPSQIANLLNVAGFHAGIGEHRPEKGGDWGMFNIQADMSQLAEAAE